MFKLAQSGHSSAESTAHSSTEHATPSATTGHGGGHHGNLDHWKNLGPGMVTISILPFVALLLMIAILPLIHKTEHWWEQNKNKLLMAGICGVLGIVLYLLPTGDVTKVVHTYIEYAAFIMLLASLFVISGGIHISGAFAGFPHVNTLFLALGAVLANVMGTTGASMLLIRPLIKANEARTHKTHIIIFFIFVVANCGGLLTPLGDPPLYLGFLRGVPFGWTMSLLPQWAFVVVMLLFIFHLLDSYMFTKEEAATKGKLVEAVASAKKKLSIEGVWNLGFLAAVVVTILLSGYVVYPGLAKAYNNEIADLGSKGFQIVVMGLATLISYKVTQPQIREKNQFSFGPILEVACIFVGIFGAMIPALVILEAKGGSMAISAPWQYYWITGVLSSFLDNAPTYLTYVTLAASKNGLPTDNLGALASDFPGLLAAISCGAVFMGANTYIGNGPNFMVKTIAEHSRIKMPSFGGYMLWSCSVLVPLLVIVTFLFFMK
jgi:Na+/H+ antiporter NhaD/arsenite permease-like protein